MNVRFLLLSLALSLAGCTVDRMKLAASQAIAPSVAVSDIADAYIKLTLEAGAHEAEYVDAYYGPSALQDAAKANPRSLAALAAEARSLTVAIDAALPGLDH